MILRIAAALLFAVAGALGAGAYWLLGTQAGLDWALERAREKAGPALVVASPRGALARGLAFDRLEWRGGATAVRAEGISGRLSLLNLLTGTVRIDGLRISSLEISLEESNDGKPNGSFGLPLRIVLSDAEVGALRIERAASEPLAFSALRFNYAGEAHGHRLRNASGVTPWGRAAIDAAMAGAAPFAIEVAGTLERREARIRARAVVHPFDETKLRSLEAGASEVDLAAIDAKLPRTRLEVHVRGAGRPGALLAGGAVVTNALPGPLDASRLPVRSLETKFVLKPGQLQLDNLQAGAAGGTVTGAAKIEAADRIHAEARLHGIDLRAVRSTLKATALAGELSIAWTPKRQKAAGFLEDRGMKVVGEGARHGETLSASVRFSGIDPARLGDYPPAALNGHAVVSGRLEPRRLAARWRVENSTLRGEPFSSRGGARLEGERLLDVDALARWADNRLAARGAYGGAHDRLAWTLSAPKAPVEGFTGSIEAHGTASGTFREPRLELEARASPAQIAGRLRARVLAAKGEGTLAAHRFTLWAAGGDYDAQATLQGGWHGAGAGWKGRVLSLSNRGRYPLELAEAVPLQASASRVEVGALRASLGEGRIALARLAWTPGRLESAGEFTGLPAAWVVAAAGAGETVRTTLLLDGRWAIASSPALEGTLRIARSGGDVVVLEPAQLALGLSRAVLEAQFTNGRMSARLDGDGRLGALQATMRTSGIEKSSSLDLQAELRLADIRVLAVALPPTLRVGGRASLHVSARGTLGEPELAGRILGEALSVHAPPYGIYLEDGVLRAALAGETIQVEELRLRGGEGHLAASGSVPLVAGRGAALKWTAERLQVLGRPDMRLTVSGEGSASVAEARRVALEGRLRVDEGYFERGLDPLPRLGDDVVVLGRARPGKAGGGELPLEVSLAIDLGRRLRVREAGFDGGLRGELKLVTEQQELRAYGRIAAADATYRAYGKTLQVDPGIVVFDGPLRNPALQIEAWRKNQEVPAGVRVSGNLEQPRVELISDPPLPEGAKLSWLVLGRAPTETTGADLAVLQTAASAMLGRADSVPITTRIADAVGLDELAVRGSSQIESRVVAVGKRLSERLYLTYEAGVGAAAQNLVKIDLSLTERITLRAQTGTSSGAGVFYRYSWD